MLKSQNFVSEANSYKIKKFVTLGKTIVSAYCYARMTLYKLEKNDTQKKKW